MKTFTKVLVVILGILMMACGISCLFMPESMTMMIGYIIGLSMVFDAIGRFIVWGDLKKQGAADGWMLAGAVLSLVFGFFVLNSEALQLSIDAFFVYYVAIWLTILGIFVIVRSFEVRRFHKDFNTIKLGANWGFALVFGILLCAFGILCMFKPLILASTIGIFMSIGVIVAGASMITVATTPVEKKA